VFHDQLIMNFRTTAGRGFPAPVLNKFGIGSLLIGLNQLVIILRRNLVEESVWKLFYTDFRLNECRSGWLSGIFYLHRGKLVGGNLESVRIGLVSVKSVCFLFTSTHFLLAPIPR
jgi:hypothetical protein